jgi:hypothetical protein
MADWLYLKLRAVVDAFADVRSEDWLAGASMALLGLVILFMGAIL